MREEKEFIIHKWFIQLFRSKEPNQKMGEVEFKVAQSAAGFLGNHLEV